MGVDELFRTQADDFLERSLKMKAARTGALGEHCQRERLLRMRADVVADFLNASYSRIRASSVGGPAPQAGAKSGAFGFFASHKETHVLSQRQPAHTRRAAIDAGSGDGEIKLAVERTITL